MKTHDPAYILVSYSDSETVKFPLTKDKTLLGTDPSCEITLRRPFASPRYAEIEKKGDYYIIRALSERGISIRGERYFEKILEPGDRSSLGTAKIEFSPPGSQLQQESQKATNTQVKRLVIYSLLLIAAIFLIGKVFLKVQQAVLTQDTDYIIDPSYQSRQPGEVKELSDQELLRLIADIKRKDIIAENLINDSDVSPGNYVRAVNQWFAALKDLENVNAPPELALEIKEKTGQTKEKVSQIVKHLKNNSFTAYQLGDQTALKQMLEYILSIIQNQVDEDYIWAKKKYLALIAKEKGAVRK